MSRASAPAVAVVLLVLVTVGAASVVATALPAEPATPLPTASLSLEADAATDRIAVTHEAGERLSVDDLSVEVTVEGTPLRHQPPIPFFAATGFESGPHGPFNVASAPGWSAGETGSFALAATNAPGITPGDRVRVVVRTDRGTVATLETVAT